MLACDCYDSSTVFVQSCYIIAHIFYDHLWNQSLQTVMNELSASRYFIHDHLQCIFQRLVKITYHW